MFQTARVLLYCGDGIWSTPVQETQKLPLLRSSCLRGPPPAGFTGCAARRSQRVRSPQHACTRTDGDRGNTNKNTNTNPQRHPETCTETYTDTHKDVDTETYTLMEMWGSTHRQIHAQRHNHSDTQLIESQENTQRHTDTYVDRMGPHRVSSDPQWGNSRGQRKQVMARCPQGSFSPGGPWASLRLFGGCSRLAGLGQLPDTRHLRPGEELQEAAPLRWRIQSLTK